MTLGTSTPISNLSLKPMGNDKPKVKVKGVYEGRQVILQTNPWTLWLTKIASLIILAVGLTLVTLSSQIALAFTISLIAVGVCLQLYTYIVPPIREKIHEEKVLSEIRNRWECKEDFSDLQPVEWKKTLSSDSKQKKKIEVLISSEYLDNNLKGLVSQINAKNDKPIFLITFNNKKPQTKIIRLYSFGKKQKKIEYVLKLDHHSIPIKKEIRNVPLFKNNFKQVIYSKT